MTSEELTFLQNYAQTGAQSAFAELARRYVDLVYSSAKRQLHGDGHSAEDVTQAVFLVLAQRAKSVPTDRPLSAWLLKVTAYCAANARPGCAHDHITFARQRLGLGISRPQNLQ